jgi:hypothetical protein
LINEFPCRPHWTKNTREVFELATKNLDPDVSSIPLSISRYGLIKYQHIARFKAVRKQFDPNGIYRSVVGEIIGVY